VSEPIRMGTATLESLTLAGIHLCETCRNLSPPVAGGCGACGAAGPMLLHDAVVAEHIELTDAISFDLTEESAT